MKLTAEYLRSVQFTIRRGNAYDAREVDAFMDELIEAVEAERKGSAAEYTQQLEAVCEIRAEMTEHIMREILNAEKKLLPLMQDKKDSAENL